jgi:hypothetical protein
MKRVTLASTILASLVTLVVGAGSALGAISSFSIQNDLDDTCYVYVNGRFAGVVQPLETTAPRFVGPSNVPGRTNLLLRCEDGGVYATSVEAIWNHCNFVVDEEGGGMRGECY